MQNHRSLEIFRTVVESGSVTAAADRLGITQPTVTKAVAEFERDCGFQLFVRGRHGMKLTTEGTLIYEEVCSNLDALTRITQRIRATRAGVQGLIRLVIPPVQDEFAEEVGRFCAQHPDITIQIEIAAPRDIILAVSRGEADLGLLPGMQEDLAYFDYVTVAERHLVALLPQAHPLAARKHIVFDDLRDERLIQYSAHNPLANLLELSFLNLATPPSISCVVSTQRMAALMAKAGAGIAIIDDGTAADFPDAGLVARPIEPAFRWSMRIIRRNELPPSPPIRLLLEWLSREMSVQAG